MNQLVNTAVFTEIPKISSEVLTSQQKSSVEFCKQHSVAHIFTVALDDLKCRNHRQFVLGGVLRDSYNFNLLHRGTCVPGTNLVSFLHLKTTFLQSLTNPCTNAPEDRQICPTWQEAVSQGMAANAAQIESQFGLALAKSEYMPPVITNPRRASAYCTRGDAEVNSCFQYCDFLYSHSTVLSHCCHKMWELCEEYLKT